MAIQGGNRRGWWPLLHSNGGRGPGAVAYVLMLAILVGGCASQAPVVHPAPEDWFREAQLAAASPAEGPGPVAAWFGEHPVVKEVAEGVGKAAVALSVLMAVGLTVAVVGGFITGR
jgi:hypothetical protein